MGVRVYGRKLRGFFSKLIHSHIHPGAITLFPMCACMLILSIFFRFSVRIAFSASTKTRLMATLLFGTLFAVAQLIYKPAYAITMHGKKEFIWRAYMPMPGTRDPLTK